MIRTALSTFVILGLGFSLAGCGSTKEPPKSDNMSVKAKQATDKKGNAVKSFEAGLEDPDYKGKKK
jgi:hypothetical protein